MASSIFNDDLVVGKSGGAFLLATNMDEAFIFAARLGDLQKLKNLAEKLRNDGQVTFESITDHDGGHTALHYASRYGRVDVCDYLVKELKVNVNVEDEAGHTRSYSLHSAIMSQKLQAAKNLMENGAILDKANKEGMTPLHCAVSSGAKDFMRLLLSNGANVEPDTFILTPLAHASRSGDKEAVAFLLKNNADPNRATAYTSPLAAASNSSLECTDLLIKAGADPNITISGSTPLHNAASAQKVEIIQYLLTAGANPNTLDEMGLTPLERAALRGKSEAVSFLFPVTSPIPSIPDWSVSGITKYIKSEEASKKISDAANGPFCFAKSQGSDCVERESYLEALMWYTKALCYDPSDAKVFSNQSFCSVRLGLRNEALSDAKACVRLEPKWPKAHYREGVAWKLLENYNEAAKSFAHALKLDPDNAEIKNALREVRRAKPAVRAVIRG